VRRRRDCGRRRELNNREEEEEEEEEEERWCVEVFVWEFSFLPPLLSLSLSCILTSLGTFSHHLLDRYCLLVSSGQLSTGTVTSSTMRITPELIHRSPAFVNALKLRELDLRANKIPAIENLGVTEDRYEALDLSDNHIARVENFPLLRRLQLLMLCNNRVARILPGVGVSLPALDTLVLSNNALAKLEDLRALQELDLSLRHLSLLGNPVQQRPHYRLFVIHLLPRLRVLDFTKIHFTVGDRSLCLFFCFFVFFLFTCASVDQRFGFDTSLLHQTDLPRSPPSAWLFSMLSWCFAEFCWSSVGGVWWWFRSSTLVNHLFFFFGARCSLFLALLHTCSLHIYRHPVRAPPLPFH
jgi:Leucine-rich repeat